MKIFAHRGFSGIAPENTMAAFEKALAIKPDGIETDVHLSKDGKVVICHDETLDRTTNGKGLIKDYTFEQLQTFDAGSKFAPEFSRERIPTLEDLLRLIRQTDLALNIELKTDKIAYLQIEAKVVALLKVYDLVERTIISSFNFSSIAKVKKLLPEISIAALMKDPHTISDLWTRMAELKVVAIHPDHKYLDHDLVDAAQKRGILINAWTPNQPEELQRCFKLQINGVITNFPDIARQLLSKSNGD
ncbi:MAG TPA: glycerophosphodiester phosphodiesterase [Bacillota bacterium]